MNCIHYSKEIKFNRSSYNKYCSVKCQQTERFLNETLVLFSQGKISTRRTIRRCLVYLRGYKCEECLNEGTYNNKPLSLQVDHKDGNAGNDQPENLRLLCPNCHSQTSTYVAKNKGKGRTTRGIKR